MFILIFTLLMIVDLLCFAKQNILLVMSELEQNKLFKTIVALGECVM